MAKRKACRNCKRITDDETCPVCKENQFASAWQGRIFVSDEKKSLIAEKVKLTAPGEYAIKLK